MSSSNQTIPAGSAALAEAPDAPEAPADVTVVEETLGARQRRLIAAIAPGTLEGPSRELDEYGDKNPNYIMKLDPANEQFWDPELYFSLRPQLEVYVRSDPDNRHIPSVPLSIAGYYLDLECEQRHTVPIDFAEELIRTGMAQGPSSQKRAKRRQPGDPRSQGEVRGSTRRMPDGFSEGDFD
jgi:hypothetical protein